jgi:hypothetical protein
VVVATLVLTTVAGCEVGQPSGFTARSNATCSAAITSIAALPAPADPAAGLRYALDRYVIVEKAVATLTDSSLPGGDTGDDLRVRWLRPARASLGGATTRLEALRQAVRAADTAAATEAFRAAVVTGTAGVDTGYLRERGLERCATLFTAVAPSTAW